MTRRFDRALAAAEVELIHARKTAKPSATHAHDRAMLFVPIAGSLRFRIDGAEVVADPLHALAVRAGVDHRHEPSDEVEYMIAYVDDRYLDTTPRSFRFANTALVRALAGELLAEAAAPAAERERDAIAAATTLLCVQARRGSRATQASLLPDDPRLAKAIELARERYRDVTPAELAKAAAMSPRAFERALARACGTTPRKLIEELRLADARARLAAGRASVTEVASELGYKSLSHFIRRFRAAFGTTPGTTRSG